MGKIQKEFDIAKKIFCDFCEQLLAVLFVWTANGYCTLP